MSSQKFIHGNSAFALPWLMCIVLLVGIACFARDASADVQPAFFLSPYLQAGRVGGADKLTLCWATSKDSTDKYRVQWRADSKAKWIDGPAAECGLVKHSPQLFQFFTVNLQNLPAGKTIEYRLLNGQAPVFQSTASTPKTASDTCNFAVFGDCGWGSDAQKKLAYKMYRDGIDYAVLTGDLVYQHGRTHEYLKNFFPIYNCDTAAPESGAPLLRSTLFYAAPGNHDLYNGHLGVSGDFRRFADGLAYYLFWNQPLNGPDLSFGDVNATPISANETSAAEFRTEAGSRFPKMASFSFDYGNAHWTVLDANPYVDWTSSKMSTWLENDLKSASKAKWRFVAMHQPAFHSGNVHGREQQMRVIAPLLEKYAVDVVFAGHVHNYQRSYPLRFKPSATQPPRIFGHLVVGEFTLDKSFDGVKATKPTAPIYIVSGCGGAPAAEERQLDVPEKREAFTAKYAAEYSYTRCELTKSALTISQLNADGKELDRIKITK